MKLAILLAFAALLGVSVAVQTEEIQVQDIAGGSGIPTRTGKKVRELIDLHEIKREVQDVAGGNGIPTGAEKMVKELIEIYERMTKDYTDDSSIDGPDASIESVFGSEEIGKQGKETARMKKDIAEIEAAFKKEVAPSYEGMSGRKLWKELMKKQKLLGTAKVQLQYLLNTKQERLNKLRGKPSNYNIPSKELSSLLSYIDEIVAYRPNNPNL